jgi:hypothetical protein
MVDHPHYQVFRALPTMKHTAIPAAILLFIVAGCAQVPDTAIPVEETTPYAANENLYGVIDIHDPVSDGVGQDQAYYPSDGGGSVTTFFSPDQTATIDPAPLAIQMPQGEVDPSNLDGDGLYAMGRKYIEGDGVEKNDAIGEHYIGLSAELGKDEAKRVLGLIRIKRNPSDSEALSMLEDAAQTSLKAQMQLGFLYANQAEPHLNDARRGLDLIENAYRGGSAEAAFYYSRLVSRSNAQASSEAMAFAVAQGYSKALLASAKAQGNSKGAADLYLRAARSGDAGSMYEYANGLLIRKFSPTLTGYDHPAEVEALAWFSLASEHGNSLATTEVNNLKGVSMELSKRGTNLDAVKRQVQATSIQYEE